MLPRKYSSKRQQHNTLFAQHRAQVIDSNTLLNAERQTDKEAGVKRGTERDRDRQTDRQTGRQTETDRERQKDI